MNLPGDEPARRLTCQEINLPGDQPARRSTCQEINLPGDQPARRSTSQEINLPEDQPARRSTCQEINLQGDQPARRSTYPFNLCFLIRILTALFYGASSFLIMVVNKRVLTVYNFPSFQVLGLGQIIATIIILKVGKLLQIVNFPDLTKDTARKIWPLPLMYLGNMVFGLGMDTTECEYLILKSKPSRAVQLSVYLMIFGTLVAASNDLAFNVQGYVFVLLNDFFTAGNGVIMKKKLDAKDLGKYGLMYYNSLFMVLPSLFFCVQSGDLETTLGNTRDHKTTLGNTRNYKTTLGNTRNHKTILGNTRNYKTTLGNTRNYKTTLGNTRNHKTTLGNTRNHKTTLGNTRNHTTTLGNTRKHKTTLGNTRNHKTTLGNTRNYTTTLGNTRNHKTTLGNTRNHKLFMCTAYNSALTTTIVGCLKNILITYLGIFIGGDYQYSLVNFIGLNISVVGSLIYTKVTFTAKARPAASETAGQVLKI
ncbi:UDP-N-acetylglucosamine/UDP-glucose/GDP-mannose transporter [Eurytemora carolleeae]|uniref:UDP-N-acetylglucosamine/UDP-glucose/GDP-mannose transporter n=1 Tax=Eurytemora carolleeae TaxID=1294199 RepID=UPI000C77B779|nr:UDP-N-acetylglucosamine/UDP-glucose/GDP-mannose transporter [Eurytemora carolleeae]|eukprot:XP_023336563.1 UDP-N-acetylglucosamine/UDP-glucose/GDP-mannose transporter-like [Eurytemora affinis]